MAGNSDPVIEAEVLEIDGKAPAAPTSTHPHSSAPARSDPPGYEFNGESDSASRPSTSWQRIPGQVRTLSPLWWPLLAAAAIVALVLLLTLGIAAAILITVFRLLRALFR